MVLGIGTSSGIVAWQTTLAEGTDLQWGRAPIDGGQTLFLTTLSHPGSAPGNAAHLLDLDTGRLAWNAALGGGQGFGSDDPILSGPRVVVRGPRGLVALDRTDGTPRWDRTGASGALLIGDQLWSVDADGAVDVLVADTGELLRRLTSDALAVLDPTQLLDLGGDRIVAVGRSGMASVDLGASPVGPTAWSGDLTDVALLDGDLLLTITDRHEVTAYARTPPDTPEAPVARLEDLARAAGCGPTEPVASGYGPIDYGIAERGLACAVGEEGLHLFEYRADPPAGTTRQQLAEDLEEIVGQVTPPGCDAHLLVADDWFAIANDVDLLARLADRAGGVRYEPEPVAPVVSYLPLDCRIRVGNGG